MARLKSVEIARDYYPEYRKIGHNTLAWYFQGNFSVRYHRTNVVQFNDATGELIVDTGGWFSKTTAQRIHHGLCTIGLRLMCTDLPGRWRVSDYHGNAWTIRGTSLVLKRDDNGWHRACEI